MNNKITGIYIRKDNNNILLEDLSFDERDCWLRTLDYESLIRCSHILCNTLNTFRRQYE